MSMWRWRWIRPTCGSTSTGCLDSDEKKSPRTRGIDPWCEERVESSVIAGPTSFGGLGAHGGAGRRGRLGAAGRAAGRGAGRRFAVDRLKDFLTVHRDLLGRDDPQSHLVAADFDDGH